MPWPAAIAAGAAIVGSVLASKGGTSKAMTGYYRAEDKIARESIYQTSVKDAKAAGLHPLFALGSSANFSPSGYMGQQTGSAAGEGIAQAGAHIAEGMRSSKKGERTVRLDAASAQINAMRLEKMGREIKLDDMEILKRASDLKMAENQLLYWGDGNPGMSGPGGMDTKTYPYGTKSGPPLNMTPLSASARESFPAFIEMIGPKGRRMVRNPKMGDEVAETDTATRPWLDYAQSFYNKKRFRPTMADPAAFYYYWKNYYKRRRK